ncbi:MULTISPECIES: heme ABC transporter permease/ATP-binding protein CydD [Pantoea]|uniref:heme ABC transporter permease/ATP-binding protein CydD n=1 Tax=Pantoea TaxID=53335 RepID=UPI000A23EFD3|nr:MULTISPECIES: cysteine/glutathione ABC transporter permease/ATP-binding protein CydD [Pantoea]KAA6048090.1 cysteine/glutathione ABC transporter permease/ATP-binding protein CydD [Pantoea sp. Bo_7]KAA6093335.1 cysteine/glutathione ABC transporter permease/ATP-binding protein CydD [Pantoea sp. Bo_10]ORM76590.1 cysteine/glutathione ABC transporter permease/ATP-binding protein CydD [Pantoea eucrina]
MNKSRQKRLLGWLRQQRASGATALRLAALCGFASALVLIAQAWLMATLLQQLVVSDRPRSSLVTQFLLLLFCFLLRAGFNYGREMAGFRAGLAIRRALRRQLLDRIDALGPAWIQGRPAGSWSTLLLEQIEQLQEYYARYLPQMTLAVAIPCAILLAVFPVNWAAGLILLVTAPLIPLFMALVGMGAADASRRNFLALSRLSGDFYDRLRGRDTLRLFHRAAAEKQAIAASTDSFRQRTMDVLRLAFLSSAVLEFFASLAIAVVAVYFGFSYLGEFNFGHYGTGVTLFAGFLALILAPEFFQPLRDLGTFYHAKAQAAGAADALETFLQATPDARPQGPVRPWCDEAPLTLTAEDLVVMSPGGHALTQPLNFTLRAGCRVALVGESGAGKTVLMNALLGFLPWQGVLRANGVDLRHIDRAEWQRQLAWVGQNPQLPAQTLRDNLMPDRSVEESRLQAVLAQAGVSAFLTSLPLGLDTPTGEDGVGLSVGQAQRIAVARALLKPAKLLLLDEPGSGLDSTSEYHVMQALNQAARQQTTLMITHQLHDLAQWDEVWVMQQGALVQQGSWQQLSREPGLLQEMIRQRQQEVSLCAQ